MKKAATTTKGSRYMKKVTENGTVTSRGRYLYRDYLQLATLDMLDKPERASHVAVGSLGTGATRSLALLPDNACTT